MYACPCWSDNPCSLLMSSSLFLQQCLAFIVRHTWMVSEIGGKWLYKCCFDRSFDLEVLKKHVAFLSSSYLAFSPCVSLVSRWCIHAVVVQQLERNHILFPYDRQPVNIRDIYCYSYIVFFTLYYLIYFFLCLPYFFFIFISSLTIAFITPIFCRFDFFYEPVHCLFSFLNQSKDLSRSTLLHLSTTHYEWCHHLQSTDAYLNLVVNSIDNVHIYIYMYPSPPIEQDATQGQF